MQIYIDKRHSFIIKSLYYCNNVYFTVISSTSISWSDNRNFNSFEIFVNIPWLILLYVFDIYICIQYSIGNRNNRGERLIHFIENRFSIANYRVPTPSDKTVHDVLISPHGIYKNQTILQLNSVVGAPSKMSKPSRKKLPYGPSIPRRGITSIVRKVKYI